MFYNHSDSRHRQRQFFAASVLAGIIGVCAVGGSARAGTPDDKQYNVMATIAAGSTGSATTSIVTVPAGKLLVITSISYYRQFGTSNSIGQLFIETSSGGTTGYIALPENKADGSEFPAATLTTTIYADSGTVVNANAYTNATAPGTEDDYITLTGYLLPQK